MITIVTINYNSSENTIKLLESLKKQIDHNFDVIIVDNNSSPEEKSKLKNYKTEETNIVYLENEHNLGFSGGCNTGIRRALENSSNWVVLLNNDTWVENGFIASLKAKLEGLEGIVGVPLVENSKLAYAGKIEWLKPTLKHVYKYSDLVGPNIYIIGGGMAVHKSVFDKIGFFDEKYFLYFEDADFSIRARKAKIPINILEQPKAYHQVSASTSKLGSPLLLRYHYRNALYFNLKNGPHYLKAVLWLWRISIMTKQLIKIVLNKNREQSLAILKGVFDYYKRRYGKII